MGGRNPLNFPPFFDKSGNHKYNNRKSVRASKKARKELQGPKKIHFPCFFEENRRTKEYDRNENAAKEIETYNRITQFFMARLAAQEFKALLAIENEMKEEKKKEREMKKERKKADDTKTPKCFGFIRRWFSKSKKKKKSVRFSESVMIKTYDPRSTTDNDGNAHQIQVDVNDVDIRLF
ncbi:uncharacterized protein LOC128559695 [Mercenaria mercenaria]|uniref:uncharacterized protein LOC128559695 n=1 Tax=Mercenaria mercenaria TaxID=6596 RepID=UPI00234F6B34|nr:uncharacterized protein LOC128559695 [Mercenaria mercenaria]